MQGIEDKLKKLLILIKIQFPLNISCPLANRDLNPQICFEIFILKKENKHLPEIPSAKEFKENGYKVGEMDNLLLKKVEELTLYIIELNKKIETLEKEVKQKDK